MSRCSKGGRRPAILFLAQVLPYPLDAGPKVRAYHVLHWLAERADVHLVCFVRADDSHEAVSHLKTVCAGVHTVTMRRSRLKDAYHLGRSVVGNSSFIIARDEVSAMRDLIANLVQTQDFAAVHADQLGMAQYARHLPIDFRVLDEHNAVFRIFERLASHEPFWLKRMLLHREARRLARYEVASLEAFDRMLFVTEEDRRAIAAAATNGHRSMPYERSCVLPICVGVDAIQPLQVRSDARRITVLGTMYWPPNAEGVIWFAEQVLPRVLEAAPDAVFTVIGKNPTSAVRRLQDRFGPSVEVLGYVADPRPYLTETAAFVVPLLSGGGMRVKILDAWAWALPVVSTTVGAEGIDICDGKDVLLADSPAGFSEHVISLLRDANRRADLGRAGRKKVESSYNASTVYDRLGTVYGFL